MWLVANVVTLEFSVRMSVRKEMQMPLQSTASSHQIQSLIHLVQVS